MLGVEYHTFSLNPAFHNAEVNSDAYLGQGLAVNSCSNRFTDRDENTSYNKQVTAAFNNQFTSFEDKHNFQHQIDTIDTGGVTSPNYGTAEANSRHKEIDDFINLPS